MGRIVHRSERHYSVWRRSEGSHDAGEILYINCIFLRIWSIAVWSRFTFVFVWGQRGMLREWLKGRGRIHNREAIT